ncbi:hypothetical protein [Nocardia sp. NPDC060259]|uniref:hypothetical protein n=1 Tax=Nocardia sp. NPDC060259 TaxID=3347088 RepID=UPI003656799B
MTAPYDPHLIDPCRYDVVVLADAANRIVDVSVREGSPLSRADVAKLLRSVADELDEIPPPASGVFR